MYHGLCSMYCAAAPCGAMAERIQSNTNLILVVSITAATDIIYI
jgi:hypothetical protein